MPRHVCCVEFEQERSFVSLFPLFPSHTNQCDTNLALMIKCFNPCDAYNFTLSVCNPQFFWKKSLIQSQTEKVATTNSFCFEQTEHWHFIMMRIHFFPFLEKQFWILFSPDLRPFLSMEDSLEESVDCVLAFFPFPFHFVTECTPMSWSVHWKVG